MTFEESFPSLKGKSGQYGMGESVNVFDIEACCLDKARVKQAIQNQMSWGHEKDPEGLDRSLKTILKELGLE